MADVGEDLQEAVKVLRGRLAEVEEQLEKMRLRVSGLERTLASVVQMDDPAFLQAAHHAYNRLNEGQRGFVGVVAIADLRSALGARITREIFDAHLVRLHDAGVIQLMPHPKTISGEKQKEGLVHPVVGAVYFLRWERRA
jgi:hypothetical protein